MSTATSAVTSVPFSYATPTDEPRLIAGALPPAFAGGDADSPPASLARASLASNCADRKSGKLFCELFPHHAERAAAEAKAAASAAEAAAKVAKTGASGGAAGASASGGGGEAAGAAAGGERALATTRARRLPYVLAVLCIAVAVWWSLSIRAAVE